MILDLTYVVSKYKTSSGSCLLSSGKCSIDVCARKSPTCKIDFPEVRLKKNITAPGQLKSQNKYICSELYGNTLTGLHQTK